MERFNEALWVRRLVCLLWVYLSFVGFAVHRIIYKFYQRWITHKARKIILILNQIAVLTYPYILYG